LIEWGWARDECVEAILAAGLAVPPKSACFFCPASTKAEVLWLAEKHPDRFQRAVAMETAAQVTVTSVKGLGRRYAWSELATADRVALPLLPEAPAAPCQCFDGD
jgi:hypothetical protein